MNIIYAFFMTWGMFLAIPCPIPVWKEEARGLMLVCLPFTGFIVGGIWILAGWLCSMLPHYGGVSAFIMMAIPYVTTGFIHLDGFMDVCDAVLSRRDLTERQRILKDSRVGAFSVICLMMLMIAGYSLFLDDLSYISLTPLLFIPVTSRACAGLAVLALRPLGSSQYAGLGRENRGKVVGLFIILTMAVAASFMISGIYGAASLGAAAGYGMALMFAYRNLGGMSGDISGFSQTLGELAGIAVLCTMCSLQM